MHQEHFSDYNIMCRCVIEDFTETEEWFKRQGVKV